MKYIIPKASKIIVAEKFDYLLTRIIADPDSVEVVSRCLTVVVDVDL